MLDEIARTSTSRGKEHPSASEQIHDTGVVSVAELRRLPCGWGLLLNRNGRPILVQMTRWWDRKDGKEIKAAAGRYSMALLAERESKDPAPVTPTEADRAEEAVAAWGPVPETASAVPGGGGGSGPVGRPAMSRPARSAGSR
ncbi:hypothetical protein ACH0AC_10510 [Micrococcus luteus]|uniref:hypothetical protein n=1 Tax=Micrococcus luteus TaxID=1270 RepID=UPI003879A056